MPPESEPGDWLYDDLLCKCPQKAIDSELAKDGDAWARTGDGDRQAQSEASELAMGPVDPVLKLLANLLAWQSTAQMS